MVVDDLDVVHREIRAGRDAALRRRGGLDVHALSNPPPESGRGRISLRYVSGGWRFLCAIARREILFLRVGSRRLLDHRTHELAVRLDPVGDRVPLVAVPLQEFHRTAALMIHARHLERLHESGCTQLLQARLADLQILDAPAHLLAGQRLLAELLLGLANRFNRDDAVDDAAVVVDRTDARLIFHLTLKFRVDVLLDVLDNREVGTRDVEAGGNVALGRVTGGDRVLFRARPPPADDTVARIADFGGGFERGRIHHAPAAQDHPVRFDLPD